MFSEDNYVQMHRKISKCHFRKEENAWKEIPKIYKEGGGAVGESLFVLPLRLLQSVIAEQSTKTR